jgi:hypothetical protein
MYTELIGRNIVKLFGLLIEIKRHFSAESTIRQNVPSLILVTLTSLVMHNSLLKVTL